MSDEHDTDDRIIVCRCEEVTIGELRDSILAGASSLNDLKRRTRSGMGLCQGVYCLTEMALLLSQSSGQPLSRFPPMTMRPPVGGVSLDALSKAGFDVSPTKSSSKNE